MILLYLYQGHMNGLYLSDYQLDWDDLYCETCGDTDWEIGYFESAIEILKYMADDINVQGSGGYDLNHVLETISAFEDCPSLEEAEKIIIENKSEGWDEY